MIYADNAATTEIAAPIMDVVRQSLKFTGNPSSIHDAGEISRNAIYNARIKIANFINAEPDEIYFTSSGSEANNMALKGFYFAHPDKFTRIMTTAIEHKSVLNSCRFLKKIGCKVHEIPVKNNGMIDIDILERLCSNSKALCSNTLVSIQFANNEIGTVQDIKKISSLVRRYGALLHVDAVQAMPEIKIDVKEYGIDMMSVSGHKFGCPKGIGFLYKRKGVILEPLIHGGGQENGLRAGTENIVYILALAKSVECINFDAVEELRNKRDYLLGHLKQIDDCIINGDIDSRLANNINISFKNVNGTSLLAFLNEQGIYVSSGSACNSGTEEPSYVLKAIGVSDDYINGTIRITIDNNITYDELDEIFNTIKNGVEFFRTF